MDVSILIVNYNTSKLIVKCINSIIFHTAGIEYEIIVVDNASSESDIKQLSSLDNIKLIRSKFNLGFGKANNLGVKSACGKYLLFLNPDTYFLNNAAYYFFSFMEQKNNIKIGTIGAKLLTPSEEFTHSFGPFPSKKKELAIAINSILKKIKCYITKDSELEILKSLADFYVDYVTGADLFMQKCLFDSLDGFDEDFFMYYEETDLQYRLAKIGYRSKIIEGAKIVHLEGLSYGSKLNIGRLYQLEISKILYMKKHSKKINYIFFRMLYFIIRFFPILFNRFSLKEKIKFYKLLCTYQIFH